MPNIIKKCKKCGGKIEFNHNYGGHAHFCRKCREKKLRRENFTLMWIVIIGFIVIFGLRFIYAKVVYKDTRCIWAECRILK